MPRTIIAIQAPAGADLSPALPYLERSGTVEFRWPSVAYVDAGPAVSTKRLHRKLVFIRATLQSLLHVPVRIGAGSSKLISLIAARQSASGGLTMVAPDTEASFLDRVVIDLLPGIGRRTAAYLRNRGVATIGTFARLPQTAAVQLFGVSGIILREFSRGTDPREVMPTTIKPRLISGRRSLVSLFNQSAYSALGVGTGASSR
jgi:DNA polymerase-4